MPPQAASGPTLRSKRLPSELLLGALVPPVLLGIVAARGIAEVMTQVGLVSEQLYQGQRLPTLNVTDSNVTDSNVTETEDS
jgi:hypothetical protein